MKPDGSAQVVGASPCPGPRLRRGGKPWAFWGKCSCPLHACGRVCTRMLSRTVTHIPAHDTCANARLHTDTHAHSLTHTQLVRSSCILQTCTITDTHTLSHAYTLTCTHARVHTHTSLTTCPGMPASPSEASSTPCWADEKQRQVRGLQSTSACPRGTSPKSPRFYTSGCQGVSSGPRMPRRSVLVLSTLYPRKHPVGSGVGPTLRFFPRRGCVLFLLCLQMHTYLWTHRQARKHSGALVSKKTPRDLGCGSSHEPGTDIHSESPAACALGQTAASPNTRASVA